MPRSKENVILVVDDDDQVRRLLCNVLADENFQVLHASDGLQALAAAESAHHDVDLLITDIMMPNVDGFELADRLASQNPKLKVLYVSGYCAHETIGARLGARQANFLPKPFMIATLLSQVQRLLKGGGNAAGSGRRSSRRVHDPVPGGLTCGPDEADD